MMKFKGYNENELNYIKDNFQDMPIKQLAENIGKTYNSVLYVMRSMGLVKQKHEEWNDSDIQYLKDNYMHMLVSDMAKYLNKSINSVNSKLSLYGLIKTKKWSEEEIDFLKNNYLIKSYETIGNILNRSTGSIQAKCFDLGLVKKEDQWTKEEEDFLRNNYYELSFKEMAKALKRSDNAIKLHGSRMGLKKYPYTCDYHFFDNIDSEEKAYWLGFLTADGWINKNDKNNAGVVGVELQYRDINHLKKLNKAVKGNYKITDRYKECSISSYKKKHHECILRFFSRKMYDSLVKQGFTNNKTFEASMPNIDQTFINDYIRGYFDGDGCLCYTQKSFNISILSASFNLINSFNHVLKNEGIICYSDYYINKLGTKMYMINIYKLEDKIKFLDYIYKDSSIYLDRKYQKYLKIKEHYTQSLAN